VAEDEEVPYIDLPVEQFEVIKPKKEEASLGVSLDTIKDERKKKSSRRIEVGDRVKVNMSGNYLYGRIKEDRGPLGVGGRRLYGILLDAAEDEVVPYIELPVEHFEVIKPKKEKA